MPERFPPVVVTYSTRSPGDPKPAATARTPRAEQSGGSGKTESVHGRIESGTKATSSGGSTPARPAAAAAPAQAAQAPSGSVPYKALGYGSDGTAAFDPTETSGEGYYAGAGQLFTEQAMQATQTPHAAPLTDSQRRRRRLR